MNDDELIDYLRSALRTPPATPDEQTMRHLTTALDELTTVRGRAVAGSTAGSLSSLRKMAGRRVSALSVVLIASLTVGGAAAAAVATDTLPGPMRTIAWDIGLPVTSPALYQARQVASQLKSSLGSPDHRGTVSLGRRLAKDLEGLDSHDFSQIQGSADELLHDVGVTAPTEVTTVTPTTVEGDSTQLPGIDNIVGGEPSDSTSGSTPESTTTTTTQPSDSSSTGDGSLDLGGVLGGATQGSSSSGD